MIPFDQILLSYSRPYLTSHDLSQLLKGTPDSRYGKVKRMLAQGKLLHIRRGLYCIVEVMNRIKKPNNFELAQYIYGPSYISLESALSYHQLIPEAVYTTTSMAGKRSKEFKSPLGVFSYQQAPLKNLYTEVELIKNPDGQFLMAKPWKALCDYVYSYRKDWIQLEPLTESLRLNLDHLPLLNKEEAQKLEEYYQQKRMSRFLKGVLKDLNV